MPVTEELKDLTATLADWASSAPSMTIYLFGSRVRGDHRPESDVDVSVQFGRFTPTEEGEWWVMNNQEDFASINQRLPGKLHILEYNDPVTQKILAAAKEPVHFDRNVVCVWMPRLESMPEPPTSIQSTK